MSERIDLTEAPIPAARRSSQKGGGRKGRGSASTKLEDFARRVFHIALIVSLFLLVYLFWGLWSGVWTHDAMLHLPQARRQMQMDNIATVFRLLQITSFIGVVSLVVCAWQAEGTGYWLLGTAVLFYGGVPFLTNQIYWMRHQEASRASSAALADFQLLAWLFAVPGVIGSVIDLGRRFGEAAEMAATQRATAKYGAGTVKQTSEGRQRQVFLGRCWEGPFCRDNIRVKCPIYLKKRGPCWWYKEGCMCEERIVLQAMINSDWKKQSTAAVNALNGGPRKILSPEAKRERCRNCVIYNEHQRQKHKALTVATLIGVPLVLVWQFAWLQTIVNQILFGLDTATKRFSFNPDPEGIKALHSGDYSIIAWVFIVALGVILLSQALKLIEYFCFKLKI